MSTSTLTTETFPTKSPPQPTLAPPPERVRRALDYRANDPQAIDNYSYLGCFSDASDSDAILTAKSMSLGELDPSLCCDLCRNVATTWSWCGVANGNYCLCDATTHQDLVTLPASRCSTECAGASGVSCGGHYAINLYRATTSFVPSQSARGVTSIKDVAGYSYYGCYTDQQDRRILTVGGMKKMVEPQFCCDYCAAQDPSYTWCGVENGDDCYCDSNTISAALAPASECGYGCWGEPDVQCGGSYRLNLYRATATTTSDAVTTTTGTGASATSSTSMTDAASSSGGSSDLSRGAIAGIVIGVVAGLALAAIAAWFLWARRARKPVPVMTPRPPTELSGSEPGSHEADAKITTELQASDAPPMELEARPAR